MYFDKSEAWVAKIQKDIEELKHLQYLQSLIESQ
jgi:hypothetical protein